MKCEVDIIWDVEEICDEENLSYDEAVVKYNLPKNIDNYELNEDYVDDEEDNLDEALGEALVNQLTDEYNFLVQGLVWRLLAE